MKHKITNFFKGSSIYIIGRVVNQMFSFITLPILTRYLSKDEYGIISLTNSISGFFMMIFGMGSAEFIVRFYWDYDGEKRKSYFGSFFFVLMFLPITVLIPLTFFGHHIFGFFFKELPFYPYILLALWIAWFSNLNIIPMEFFKIKNQPFRFISVSFLTSFLTVFLTIILLTVFSYGPLSPFISIFALSIIFGIYYLYYTLNEIKFSYSLNVTKTFLKFNFPILLILISRTILSSTNIWVLQRYATLGDVAIYSIAASLGIIVPLLITSINSAWAPFYYENIKKSEENTSKLFGLLIDYILICLIFIILWVIVVRHEIVLILASEKYMESTKIFPILVIGYLFNGIMFFGARGMFVAKKTSYLSYITISITILNFILSLIFIPVYGIVGAACASTGSFVLMFFITHVVSQKYFKIEYNYSRLFKLLIISIAVFMIGEYSDSLFQAAPFFNAYASERKINLILMMIYKSFILLLYPFLLFSLNYFDESEIRTIKNGILKVRNMFSYIVIK